MEDIDYDYFSYLFKTSFMKLVLYGKKYVGSEDEAKDIVQDCFLKLWRMKSEVRRSTAKALVFMMVRNSCLNLIRHRVIERNFEREVMVDGDCCDLVFHIDFLGDPEQASIYDELNRMIMTEVNKMPLRCREVFVMSRYQGLSNRKIAGIMDISEPAVHKHLENALDKLKAVLSVRDTYVVSKKWK